MDWTYTKRGAWFGAAAVAIGTAAIPWTDKLLARGIMTMFWIVILLGAVDLLRHALRRLRPPSDPTTERPRP